MMSDVEIRARLVFQLIEVGVDVDEIPAIVAMLEAYIWRQEIPKKAA